MLHLVLFYDAGKKAHSFQCRVTHSSKNLTYKTRKMKPTLVHHRHKKAKKS